ncbi:putative bifunctional diguanylate cyclase/phosphodiesterase [Pelotalea chapellei]|uniref:EAL domain-containing protein n=1 Tax=Pelotalea chapellei TaxID=44671 RepID=A0ABS5UCR1_9BACT|nr:EAL domain-containing protein [Pelotalea chapellei]MBT1073472.1 EAL domain-containing protein [Pelotalea chapellei]
MGKKGNKDQKGVARNLPAANKHAGSPDVDASQRKQAADLRQGTAGLRQEAASLRQDTAVQRNATADQREKIADLRQNTADKREEIADLREGTADLRQDTADLRQDAADQREERARVKAINSEHANARIREANERLILATIRAQTMTAAAELATAQMSYMAEHDFLTGLPNRSLLTDRLSQSIALAQRHQKKVALMFLDLDHFKHINDSLGHAVGDQLLQSVAKRLQASVRLSDTVSRQGGDEFVVLLSEIDGVQDAVLSADKLLDAMVEPHYILGHQLRVNVSIGISIYPDDGMDVETVMRNADTAMYQAKNSGRNTFQVFLPEMNIRAVERQSIEQALHRALEQHKFLLHYQPKVNLDTGAITGAEALIRMQETDDQLVYPMNFITIAEESGLILPIGRWALREACRQAKAWLEAGLDIGQIAVNVSSREFHSKDFLEGLIAILNETGLDPGHLELEMTESGLMQDTEPTTVLLHALKKLGVHIAIDDFGTGYSSLSYLMRFPIDTLKIDRSFVRDLDDDDTGFSGEAIVSAVIAMGSSLKQRVVAEGIETQHQLAFLQSHHCVEGQGFYFSRPVPADEFAALLAARGAH